jgi:hypothetical protein
MSIILLSVAVYQVKCRRVHYNIVVFMTGFIPVRSWLSTTGERPVNPLFKEFRNDNNIFFIKYTFMSIFGEIDILYVAAAVGQTNVKLSTIFSISLRQQNLNVYIYNTNNNGDNDNVCCASKLHTPLQCRYCVFFHAPTK